MISKEQVIDAQTEWGNGVVKIGSLKDSRKECEDFSSEFLDKLYSFTSSPLYPVIYILVPLLLNVIP